MRIITIIATCALAIAGTVSAASACGFAERENSAENAALTRVSATPRVSMRTLRLQVRSTWKR
ncbi:hypothetical protein HYW84_02795 [Candidatus Peregrinibacteria bacterium]|nr:hypothetical protein [Candidatus Peregrinibacteria bacterium]